MQPASWLVLNFTLSQDLCERRRFAERKRSRSRSDPSVLVCALSAERLGWYAITRVEKPPRCYHLMVVRFVPPCSPVLAQEPPTGPGWLHEVKFDGWRVQIHKQGERVKLYSRNGKDLADRFSMLRDACLYLPDCVIDDELVACDTDGRPDFSAITKDHANLCIWCFDLLAHEHQDIREKPLVERKAALRDLLIAVDDDRLRYSEEFADPVKLLQVAGRMGLEGIVSKRKQAPYRSWTRREWVKLKTSVWREANKDRWEMFEKKGRKVSA